MPKPAPSLEQLTDRMRTIQLRAIKKKRTVATAESCTGGMLGTILTAHGGSSGFYKGGAIVYDNDAKTVFADVAPDLPARVASSTPTSGLASPASPDPVARRRASRSGSCMWPWTVIAAAP